MQIKNKKLLENSIAVFLTQLISYVIPLISLPYLSRVLGVEKFGLVYWAQSCIAYFLIITDFGFNYSAVQRIASNRDNNDKINCIFSSVMFIKLSFIIICFIVLNVLLRFIPQFQGYSLLFNATYLLVIGNSLYPTWYFLGIEHMKYVTFLNIIAKTIFLLLLFIFVHKPEDFILVAFFNSCGFMIAGIFSILVAIKRFNLKIITPRFKNILFELKYSSEFFLAIASESIYSNTNSFILGLVTSPIMVGYYVAAEKIFIAINGLRGPLTTPLFPYMTKNKDIKLFKKIIYILIPTLAIICILTYILAPKIIVVFYGVGMYEAYKVLRIFCVTLFLATISATIGYPLLAALGHANIVNRSAIVAAIFQLVLIFILFYCKQLNLETIALMTIVPEVIMLTIRVVAIKKYHLLDENYINN